MFLVAVAATVVAAATSGEVDITGCSGGVYDTPVFVTPPPLTGAIVLDGCIFRGGLTFTSSLTAAHTARVTDCSVVQTFEFAETVHGASIAVDNVTFSSTNSAAAASFATFRSAVSGSTDAAS